MLIEQIATRPTCEINGIIGGYTGEGAKTVIPGQATAKVSFRLVGEQDPEKIREAFRAFVRARLPADCKVEFDNFGGAPATATAVTTIRRWPRPARRSRRNGARRRSRSARAARSRSSAISSACSAWTRFMVGFALDDDRVHSPNEKYDLTSFHKGTRSWARILAALAE